MAPRETENNAHAKFWGDKQRALWYVIVFSGVVNTLLLIFASITACRNLGWCYAFGNEALFIKNTHGTNYNQIQKHHL